MLALDHQVRQDRWEAQTQTVLGAAKHPACHPSRLLLLLTCSWWRGRWIVSEQCREQLKMEIGKPHPDPSPQPAMGYSLEAMRQNVGLWPCRLVSTLLLLHAVHTGHQWCPSFGCWQLSQAPQRKMGVSECTIFLLLDWFSANLANIYVNFLVLIFPLFTLPPCFFLQWSWIVTFSKIIKKETGTHWIVWEFRYPVKESPSWD